MRKSELTTETCDIIALEQAGVIVECASEVELEGWQSCRLNSDYRTRVIKTGGPYRKGAVVLQGVTQQAKQLLHVGRIAKLTREGVSSRTAKVAVRHVHGMEVEVARLADQLVPLCQEDRYQGNSFREFKEWSGILPKAPLTYPRILAAISIAQEVAGDHL